MKELFIKFIQCIIFSIAFAFIETSVVIYLRTIYYPDGFSFPLHDISNFHYTIELIREFSTIILLFIIALILGKNILEKNLYFLFLFGLWDIFYYLFLKLTLNWPTSLLTWDILFLIPITWASPVLVPIIIAITMVFISGYTHYLLSKKIKIKISYLDLAILLIALFILFISFILPFSYISKRIIPEIYHWELLIIGELLILFIFIKSIIKIFKNK